MYGIRLYFAPMSPARRPFAKITPEPPANASAGINKKNPHDIAVLTDVTTAWEANSSVSAVESQKLAMVTIAMVPAIGWINLVTAFCPFLSRAAGYATQMPGTATFLKRCGEATAEAG